MPMAKVSIGFKKNHFNLFELFRFANENQDFIITDKFKKQENILKKPEINFIDLYIERDVAVSIFECFLFSIPNLQA